MSGLIPPPPNSVTMCEETMCEEHHHLKVHLDICMVTRKVKVLIIHQIWLIYGRSMRGIINLLDLQMHTIGCIIWMHEPGICGC